MIFHLLLLLCQTSSAVHATQPGDYEQLIYAVIEIAGNVEHEHFDPEIQSDVVSEAVSDLVKILWGKGKEVFDEVYNLFQSAASWISDALQTVNKYINDAADKMIDFVKQTRKDLTGAYGVVSGLVKEKVDAGINGAEIFVDSMRRKGLAVADDLKEYNIQAGSALRDIIDFSASVSKRALKAANITITMGDAVFFVVFNSTLDYIESKIIEKVESFRDKVLKYMISSVELIILYGVMWASAPIIAPLLIAILGESIFSGFIMTFITKTIEVFYLKRLRKGDPAIYDTVKCYFSARFGKLVLLVMETMVAAFMGDIIGETITADATTYERTIFRKRAHSPRILQKAETESGALSQTLIELLDYMLGVIQMILFPDDEHTVDANDCFPHLKNITFEDVLKVHLTFQYKVVG